MKKFKRLLSLVLIALSFALVGNLFLTQKKASADSSVSPDSYFDVMLTNYDASQEDDSKYTSQTPRANVFQNNSAFFVTKNTNAVSVMLGFNGYEQRITNSVVRITINGNSFDVYGNDEGSQLVNYGMEVSPVDGVYFVLRINPAIIEGSDDDFTFGKYSFDFSYYFKEEDNTLTYVEYSRSIYVLSNQDYNKTNITFNNAGSFNTQGDRFYSNYSAKTSNADLMYLEYNYRFYNINISRVSRGLTNSTTITYNQNGLNFASLNELNAQTNKHVVDVMVIDDPVHNTFKARLVFRELGEYYISYTPICPYSNYEALSVFYSGDGNLDVPQLKNQTAFVFGYQIYYTDSNGLMEFKHTDETEPYKINDLQYTADITNRISDIDDVFESTKIDSSKIARTNQAPVYFVSNASMNTTTSCYYYFDNVTTFNSNEEIDSISNYSGSGTQKAYKVSGYTGTPLSKAGIYLVKLNYSYSKYTLGDADTIFTQYFLFKITNDAPIIDVYTLDGENHVGVDTDSFTYKNIFISKSSLGIFDSSSTLTLYKDKTFNNQYDAGTVIDDNMVLELTENAKYKLQLTYGNKNKKGFTSYFTLDNSNILGLSVNPLVNTSGYNYVVAGNAITSGITSSPISISWNEKASGVGTHLEYKYFPTKYSADNFVGLTSELLYTMYNSQMTKYSIPSTYVVSYNGGALPVSEYANTFGRDVLSSSEILSGGGLYIFYLYDDTGRDGTYFSVFIDNTPNSIITTSSISNSGDYEIATENELTSLDRTLIFGNTKLIKINYSGNSWDEWLSQEFLNADNSITFRNQTYIKVGLSNIVYMVKDTSVTYRLVLTDNYSYDLKASTIEPDESVIYNESQYDFYTICESTDNTSAYQKDSVDYYRENCSSSHTILFSTDNSKMKVYYNDNNSKQQMLSQRAVVSKNTTEKTNYYQPTGVNTLGNSEMLYLNYCTIPSPDLMVESITLNYYPFVKDANNKTYIFNDSPSATVQIFENGSINRGTYVAGEMNTYKYEIYPEQYGQSSTRTASGRYEIIRTYASNGVNNDPKVRRLVFIVDRNGIISAPDTDNYGNSIYYTGGSIALGITGGIDDFYSSLQYYDIYYANMLNPQTPVLTTNFLPVTVYIPEYKYSYLGETESGALKTNSENSIIEFEKNQNYDYLKLRAVVYYSPVNSPMATETYVYNNNYKVNGFINTNNSKTLQSFSKVGKYKVVIDDLAGDSFSYVFEIQASKPEFSLLNTDNSEVYYDSFNDTYYTNKNVVRISWEDSANKFLSTINKDEIHYSINGNSYQKINKNEIVEIGENKFYVDLNLEELGAYADNTNVTITLQFKGNPADYADSTNFSKTVSLKVDLQAPTSNILRLIQTTGLKASDLRSYVSGEQNKYNTSKTEGLLKYYSYTVDISNFNDLIKIPSETNYDYYKSYYRIFQTVGANVYNTKYVAGYDVETDITINSIIGKMTAEMFTSSTKYDYISEFGGYIGSYIEIVEEDYAGNRSVYTIYLTNVSSNEQKDIINYTRLTNTTDGETENTLKNADIISSDGNISLYSKNSFKLKDVKIYGEELNDLTWTVLKVNGKIYVKSPYTFGKYLCYNFNDTNEYLLEEVSLLQASSSVQKIELYSVPTKNVLTLNVHVLNQNLSIYKLSQIEDDLVEGIYIKIPSSSTSSDNNLYAKSLQIITNINGISEELISFDEELAKYLQKEPENIVEVAGLNISYRTIGNNKYVRIQITKRININDYFIYNVVDNFDDKYTIINIYGQTIIKEPITCDEYLTSNYDDLGLVYYSCGDITYKFDTTIYTSAIVNIAESIGGNLTNKTYRIKKQNDTYYVELEEDGIFNRVTANIYSDDMLITLNYNVMSIKMIHVKYNFEELERVLGGSKIFEIITTPKSEFNIDEEKNRFEIFNELPSGLTMLSKNTSNDALSVLVGDKAYPDSIIINFSKSTLKFDYDIVLETPNHTFITLKDNNILDEDGIYTLTINYIGAILGCSKSFTFRIANSENFKYSVSKLANDGSFEEVEATGSAFTFVSGGAEYQIINHYIVNSEYKIIVNSNLDLQVTEDTIQPDSRYFTKVYIITNRNSTSNAPKSYDKVAITKLESTDNLLKRLLIYGGNISEQNNDLIRQNLLTATAYVTTSDEYEAGIKLAWSKYYGIAENSISAEIYYGSLNSNPLTLQINDVNSLNSITLKTSGTYYIRFKDMAGNTHLFGNNSNYRDSEYITLKYLSSVIYEINGDVPINYSIYNGEVNVKVPQNTISYYAIDGKPRINVELNGEKYTDYKQNSLYDFTFSKPGLYKIWFTAKIGDNSIYESPLYFTIVSSNESRISYTHTSFASYCIEDLLLNDVSMKDKLFNVNSGEMIGDYLKNIYIHANDLKTGMGLWTFVINTNNEFNQKFTYSIWINRPDIPIEVSIKNGEATTDNIMVKFNTNNIIDSAGDCILKITGFNSIVLTKEKLLNGELDDVYSITIDDLGGHYIEVTTLSGQLLYTYYVVKNEPLNAISIIIITAASILAVAGSVVFILMRKRMKVR